MRKSKNYWNPLTLQVVLTTLIGGAVIWSWSNQTSGVKKELRAPASITNKQINLDKKTTTEKTNLADTKVLNLDVDCDKTETPPIVSQANYVRVNGIICVKAKPGESISALRVQNASNGYGATVFPMKDPKKFTTDYLNLQLGANEIRIQQADGQERKFIVIRQ